jgi:hypothetical protein
MVPITRTFHRSIPGRPLLESVSMDPLPSEVFAGTGISNFDAVVSILALKIMTGMKSDTIIYKEVEVNGDEKIGIEEAVFVIQDASK